MPFQQARPEVSARAQASAASSAAQGFYSQDQAATYTTPANASIQRDLTHFALEVLHVLAPFHDGDVLLLDVGAGSGLSTVAASRWLESRGIDSFVLAFDISASMLLLTATGDGDEAERVRVLEDGRKVITSVDCGDRTAFYCGNAAHKLPLRARLCDAAIGISMLQWLTNDGLRTCYTSLLDVLRPQSAAVFQIYPTSPEQVEAMESIALDVGFAYAEVVVGFPHSASGKKWFLALKKTVSPKLQASLNVRARDQTLCPFGRRSHRRCAWHLFRNASADTSSGRLRERLGREHVKEAWHIYRKFHRAQALAKQVAETGKPLHAKAMRSLELWTSDEVIGEALSERFLAHGCEGRDNNERTTKISYDFLLNKMDQVVDVLHLAYSKAVAIERKEE